MKMINSDDACGVCNPSNPGCVHDPRALFLCVLSVFVRILSRINFAALARRNGANLGDADIIGLADIRTRHLAKTRLGFISPASSTWTPPFRGESRAKRRIVLRFDFLLTKPPEFSTSGPNNEPCTKLPWSVFDKLL